VRFYHLSRLPVMSPSTFDVNWLQVQPQRLPGFLCSWKHHSLFMQVNPLESKGNYSATSNNTKLYAGRSWVGCYIWCPEKGPERAVAPPSPLRTVPNVKTHPSMASVPVTVLHCCMMVRCSAVLMWRLKG